MSEESRTAMLAAVGTPHETAAKLHHQLVVCGDLERRLEEVKRERRALRDILREWLEADVAAEIDFNATTEARLDAAIRAAQEAVRA